MTAPPFVHCFPCLLTCLLGRCARCPWRTHVPQPQLRSGPSGPTPTLAKPNCPLSEGRTGRTRTRVNARFGSPFPTLTGPGCNATPPTPTRPRRRATFHVGSTPQHGSPSKWATATLQFRSPLPSKRTKIDWEPHDPPLLTPVSPLIFDTRGYHRTKRSHRQLRGICLAWAWAAQHGRIRPRQAAHGDGEEWHRTPQVQDGADPLA
jgi:hypothetical protein